MLNYKKMMFGRTAASVGRIDAETARMNTAESRPALLTRKALEQSPLYSEALGIDLAGGGEEAWFAWFIASQLYGGRIAELTAARTFAVFAEEGLLSADAIVTAGRAYLINPVMRRGGYVRYDNRKAEQILRACGTLIERYGGRAGGLHDAATDAADLESRLRRLYGVGPVTANIFLRELRLVWLKADPEPMPIVAQLGRVVDVDTTVYDRKTLAFVRLEAGLLRHRRQLEWRIGAQGSIR